MEVLKKAILSKVTEEAMLLAFQGKKVSKQDKAQIEDATAVDEAASGTLMKFVRYESMAAVKTYTSQVIQENKAELLSHMHSKQPEKPKEQSSGIFSYFGWGKSQEEDKQEEDEFLDALDTQLDEMEIGSQW